MDSVVASLSFQSPSSPLSRVPFTAIRPIPNRRLIGNSPKRPRKNLISLASIAVTPPISFAAKSTPTPSESAVKEVDSIGYEKEEQSISECLSKQLVRALFCFAVGFSAFGMVRAPALAIAAAPAVLEKKGGEKGTAKSHEYSDCTDRLLETVSGLLRSIEEVRKGSASASEVELALKAVKTKKEELQREIMDRLYPELRELRRDKRKLVTRAGEIVGEILNAKGEYDKLRMKVVTEEEKGRVEVLEQRVGELEQEYNGTWERVGEIEDWISRKETVAFSYGVREIAFIERECEQLVERFKQEMRQKDIKRSHALIT